MMPDSDSKEGFCSLFLNQMGFFTSFNDGEAKYPWKKEQNQ